jgi:hypothetical protein
MSRIKNLLVVIAILSVWSCKKPPREVADYLIHADRIYTCDSAFTVVEAVVVKDGKIIATGEKDDLLARYKVEEIKNGVGTIVYPGWIDGHCHFYGYGKTASQLNLKYTASMEDLVERVKQYATEHPEGWILGRGWDQTDWEIKTFPSKTKLDFLFPDRPVVLKRIDGHAALVNQAALDAAGISVRTKVEGGEVELRNGRLTGMLIDNAVELVMDVVPEPTRLQKVQALLKAQEDCIKEGLTAVTDAGLDLDIIILIDSLMKSGDLVMPIYAMMSPTTENRDYFFEGNPNLHPNLKVRSVKLYADGALGSRGALLKKPYCDDTTTNGLMLTPMDEIHEWLKFMAENNGQVNTHCIGDSANTIILRAYSKYLDDSEDLRWRIEHAQVVSPVDRSFFGDFGILPSVQPTHAISDMNWAEDRICKDRMAGAYAYQSLLKENGMLVLGTDFPVEEISPLNTFKTAVFRKDARGYPVDGFLPEEKLSRSQALLGMTAWAAYGQFMENKIGSIQTGKQANFTVVDRDIMAISHSDDVRVLAVYIGGELR